MQQISSIYSQWHHDDSALSDAGHSRAIDGLPNEVHCHRNNIQAR